YWTDCPLPLKANDLCLYCQPSSSSNRQNSVFWLEVETIREFAGPASCYDRSPNFCPVKKGWRKIYIARIREPLGFWLSVNITNLALKAHSDFGLKVTFVSFS